MELPLYQIDAFSNQIFGGNPAAVCPLNTWLPADVMQAIAAENNLAETAFYIKENNQYAIRWFTPEVEVDLCGHATLAAAYVIFHFENFPHQQITFYSERSGILLVSKNNDLLTLDFPTDILQYIGSYTRASNLLFIKKASRNMERKNRLYVCI